MRQIIIKKKNVIIYSEEDSDLNIDVTLDKSGSNNYRA